MKIQAIALLWLVVFLAPMQDGWGSKPACRRDYGSALLNAIADRKTDEVIALLAQGADPNQQASISPYLTRSALQLTIDGVSTGCVRQKAAPELFRLLLSAGADIHATMRGNASAETHNALHIAALSNNAEMAGLTIEAGIAVDTHTSWDRTALLIAAQSGYTNVMERLLRAGADPNVSTSGKGYAKGMSPLHFVVDNPGKDNLPVKLLIRYGAKYQSGNLGGPLGRVAQFCRVPGGNIEELIDLLVAIGGNVNEGERENSMPLNLAVTSVRPSREVFEALL